MDVYIPGCPPSPPATIYGFACALGLLDQSPGHGASVQQHIGMTRRGHHLDAEALGIEGGGDGGDQKLHESRHVAPAGEQAPVAFPAIPYKVRTAFEREARRMSGYVHGKNGVGASPHAVVVVEDAAGAAAGPVGDDDEGRVHGFEGASAE